MRIRHDLIRSALLFYLGLLLTLSAAPLCLARGAGQYPRLEIARIAEDVNNAVVNIQTQGSKGGTQYGSGFIVDGHGMIVTNYHVIQEALRLGSAISVSLPDGRVSMASVKGFDPPTDLALLEVEVEGDALPAVRLGDSDSLRIGEWVIAIGTPFGLDHTVTLGIISSKGRRFPGSPFNDFLQTDAAINPGNSGGPLVNLNGEVIGISTFTSRVGEGLSFAIPVNTLKDVLPELRRKGRVTRGHFAVQVVDTTPYMRKRLGLTRPGGVLVIGVQVGSTAAQARIRREDIITEVNGKAIAGAGQFNRLIAGQPPGAEISLTIFRNKREYKVKGLIEAEPSSPRE